MTQPYYPPTPGVGDVISRSFRLFRRRPGLMIGLGAVPAITTALVGLLAIGLMWSHWATFIMAAARQDWERLGQLSTAWVALVMVASVLAGVINVLTTGLLTRVARDAVTERRTTLGELLGTLGGFAARMLPLALAGMVLYVGAVAVALGPMLPAMMTLIGPDPDTGALAGGTLFTMLLSIVLGVLGLFVFVRLLYLVQVVSLEELGWTAALRRAWQLTAGAFWRTFGTYLVAYLLIYVVTLLASTVTQVLMMPVVGQVDTMNPLSPEFATTLFLPVMVATVPQALLQGVSLPFLQSVITVMYLNRTRELAMPAPGQPAPGYQPMPYQPPAAPYGYGPPQGYGPMPPQGPAQPPAGYGQAQPPGYPAYGQWPPAQQPPYPPAGQPPQQPPYPSAGQPPQQPGPYGWQPPASGPPETGNQQRPWPPAPPN